MYSELSGSSSAFNFVLAGGMSGMLAVTLPVLKTPKLVAAFAAANIDYSFESLDMRKMVMLEV